jgi:hypothetical protein
MPRFMNKRAPLAIATRASREAGILYNDTVFERMGCIAYGEKGIPTHVGAV